MDQLFTQIEQHITQLFPETISKKPPKNQKTSTNFLGSALKAITGNLDSDDGQRYETLISPIQIQQDKQKILLDEQISLTTTAIEKFNKSIARLTINQQIFKKKIEIYPLLHLIAFLQMITVSQEILRILEELETAISFAKLNTLHNSIIDPKDLLSELKILENKLDEKSLAYEPDTREIKNNLKIMKVEIMENRSKIEQSERETRQIKTNWEREKKQITEALIKTENKMEKIIKEKIRNNLVITGIETTKQSEEEMSKTVESMLEKELEIKAKIKKA